MKQLLFIPFLWLSSFQCYTQPLYTEKIWDYTDSFPKFPGGIDSLLRFIDENLIYPLELLELDSSKGFGRQIIFIQSIIEKNGSIQGHRILKYFSDCITCGKEAVSVMKSLPQWRPGYITIKRRDEYYQSLRPFEEIWRESNKWMRESRPLESKKDTIIEELPPKKIENKDSLLVVKSITTTPIRFIHEKLPKLPYGIDSLTNYINTHLVYPERAINQRIQGKVDVKIMFDEIGELKDVLLLQGMENCLECDEEALILLRNMPKDLMRANDSPNSPKPFFFNTFIEFRLE